MTSDGPRGSLWYCAPELRNPRIQAGSSLKTADVYSLGKVLYWLYTHDVYDGHEEEYSNVAQGRLSERFAAMPEFAFIDELVAGTVIRDPNERVKAGFPDAVSLHEKVTRIIDRIEAGGRVLDLAKPMRCLFCANGVYKMFPQHLGTWPDLKDRLADRGQRPGWDFRSDIFAKMRDVARTFYGDAAIGQGSPVPLILVCQHCGNVQHFRLDAAPGAIEVWRP